MPSVLIKQHKWRNQARLSQDRVKTELSDCTKIRTCDVGTTLQVWGALHWRSLRHGESARSAFLITHNKLTRLRHFRTFGGKTNTFQSKYAQNSHLDNCRLLSFEVGGQEAMSRFEYGVWKKKWRNGEATGYDLIARLVLDPVGGGRRRWLPANRETLRCVQTSAARAGYAMIGLLLITRQSHSVYGGR